MKHKKLRSLNENDNDSIKKFNIKLLKNKSNIKLNLKKKKMITFKQDKKNQKFLIMKIITLRFIIKETATITTELNDISVMLSWISESVKSEDSKVCDSSHLKILKFKISQKSISKVFSCVTTSMLLKQSYKAASLKFLKQAKIMTLLNDYNQSMITTLQTQLKREKKAHEQFVNQIKVFKMKNTDIEEECKIMKNMLNNAKINHKITI